MTLSFRQCPKKTRLAAGRAEAQEETKPIQKQLRLLKTTTTVVRAAGKREILKNRQVLKSREILKRVPTDPLKAHPAG